MRILIKALTLYSIIFCIGCSDNPSSVLPANHTKNDGSKTLIQKLDLDLFLNTEEFYEETLEELNRFENNTQIADYIEDLKLNYQSALTAHERMLESRLSSSSHTKKEELIQKLFIQKIKMEILKINNELIKEL